MARSTGLHGSTRVILLVAWISYYARKYFHGYLFPHGFPEAILMEDRLKFAQVDKSNDSLQSKHGKLTKIVERIDEGQKRLLIGPETVFVHPKTNALYAFSRARGAAKLVRLDDLQPSPNDTQVLTAKVTVAAHLGMGAPISGKFTEDGKTLYVVDTFLGLFRIRNFQDNKTTSTIIELIANKVVDNGKLTQILYADDIAIGPKTGKVFFSDATDVAPDRLIKGDWDLLYASKVDCVRGKRAGRLLEYDPATDETTVLARNLSFANGVSVDAEETFVVVSQTFGMRLSKYHLSGPRQGDLETILDSHQLTGFIDGVDCSWATSGPSTGKCYVAVPTPIIPLMKMMQFIPHPLDQILRGLLLMLPKKMAPKPVNYGGVVELDMETGETRTFQDPDGIDQKFITGVTVHDDKLYLGSLHNNVVGVYDLN